MASPEDFDVVTGLVKKRYGMKVQGWRIRLRQGMPCGILYIIIHAWVTFPSAYVTMKIKGKALEYGVDQLTVTVHASI